VVCAYPGITSASAGFDKGRLFRLYALTVVLIVWGMFVSGAVFEVSMGPVRQSGVRFVMF